MFYSITKIKYIFLITNFIKSFMYLFFAFIFVFMVELYQILEL